MIHDSSIPTTPTDAPRKRRRWWSNPSTAYKVAALIGAVGLLLWGVAATQTKNDVGATKTVVEQLKVIADATATNTKQNQDALDRLEANQRDLDLLVKFVQDVQAQQQASGQSHLAQDIIAILCSSTDPLRREACVRLGYDGDGG